MLRKDGPKPFKHNFGDYFVKDTDKGAWLDLIIRSQCRNFEVNREAVNLIGEKLKSFGTSEGGSFQKYFKDSEFSKDFEVSITYGGVEIAPSLLKSMDLDKAEELFMKFDNITT
jgi:hypothetical protein